MAIEKDGFAQENLSTFALSIQFTFIRFSFTRHWIQDLLFPSGQVIFLCWKDRLSRICLKIFFLVLILNFRYFYALTILSPKTRLLTSFSPTLKVDSLDALHPLHSQRYLDFLHPLYGLHTSFTKNVIKLNCWRPNLPKFWCMLCPLHKSRTRKEKNAHLQNLS